MAKASTAALFLLLASTATPFRISAEELEAGSLLEARLNVATGSGISRAGDRVSATIIAPVYADGRMIIPQDATVSGRVQKVVRLGLGLKHLAAAIAYDFDTLRLPGGEVISIKTSLTEVETAK